MHSIYLLAAIAQAAGDTNETSEQTQRVVQFGFSLVAATTVRGRLQTSNTP